jgi:hypothetical protein
MDRKTEKEFKDIPLSESNVSLKLADIQRRCSQLLQEESDSLGLSLEEPVAPAEGGNPYDRG